MPVSCSVVLSSLCAFRLVGGNLIHSGFGVVIQLNLLLACCVGLTVLESQSFAWVSLLCVGLAFAWLSICGGSILCRHRVASLWIGGSQFKRYSVRENSGMFLVCDFKTKSLSMRHVLFIAVEACTVLVSRVATRFSPYVSLRIPFRRCLEIRSREFLFCYSLRIEFLMSTAGANCS